MPRSRKSRASSSKPAAARRAGWWSRLDQLRAAHLFWWITAVAFVVRVAANVVFAAAHGRYASINPEIWFYHAVAEGQHPDIYRLLVLDPTRWVLEVLGMVLGGDALLSAILVVGSLTMAMASGAVGCAARALSGRTAAGLAAALIYLTMSWPYGASLSGFTHDTLGMAIVALALYCGLLVLDESTARRSRVTAAAGMVACWVFGSFVGPSIVAVFLATVIAALLQGSMRLVPARVPIAAIAGGVMLIVTLALTWAAVTPNEAGSTWVTAVWERLAGAARSQRGIDLALQSRQGSADVLPGHPRALIAAYTIGLSLLAVAGAVVAVRRRRLLLPAFLCIGFLGFLVAHRGARLLDVAVAVGAALAMAEIVRLGGRRGVVYPVAGALVVLAVIHGVVAPATAVLAAGIGLALLLLAVAGRAWGAAAFAVAAAVLVMGAHAAVDGFIAVGDAHVRALRAVRQLDPEGASSILPASWDLGYMVGAVSGCRPAAHPQAINAAGRGEPGENDGKIFWSPATAAAGEAQRRGIRFLYLGERDFSFVEEYPSQDQFRSRRRRGVQVPTMSAAGEKGPLPLSIVRQLLIYKLLNEPDRMSTWRLVAEEVERNTGERVRVFELVKPPEPERTYVIGILHNTSNAIAEASLQLGLERDGVVVKRGARLNTRVAPRGSSTAMFSFLGQEEGRGTIELSNPDVEVRMLARLSQGIYTVDMVRPERGWRPLASE